MRQHDFKSLHDNTTHVLKSVNIHEQKEEGESNTEMQQNQYKRYVSKFIIYIGKHRMFKKFGKTFYGAYNRNQNVDNSWSYHGWPV